MDTSRLPYRCEDILRSAFTYLAPGYDARSDEVLPDRKAQLR